MNTENEPGSHDVPSSITATSPNANSFYPPQKREPHFRLGFFFWAPLFVFVSALVLYFFFPDALNQAISLAYKEYNQYFPQPATPHSVAADVTPSPAKFVAPPPPQTYTLQEIRDTVQDHLLQFGIVDKGTSFDWKQLVYSDPADLNYQLYAHLSRGSVEFCMGTVALDMQDHKMVVTSQLQGW